MKKRVALRSLSLAIVGLFAAVFSVAAQDVKETGKVSVGTHEVDFKSGSLYLIKVAGKGFQPRVSMRPGFLPYVQPDFKNPNVFQSYYMPKANEKVTIYIAPELFNLNGKGPFEYEFEVKAAALAAKPITDIKDELTDKDPPFKAGFVNRPHHKNYVLKASMGRFYVIDMKSPVANALDSYLYLVDDKNNVVMFDDDGGGFPSARLVFRAPKDAEYRIICTSFGKTLGKFEITVKTTESK